LSLHVISESKIRPIIAKFGYFGATDGNKAG
jgi:hypothetical protein